MSSACSTKIESELSTEDPKFASSVRGGSLRAPSARRRFQGAALFVIGVAMLVSGVAFKASMNGLADRGRHRVVLLAPCGRGAR